MTSLIAFLDTASVGVMLSAGIFLRPPLLADLWHWSMLCEQNWMNLHVATNSRRLLHKFEKAYKRSVWLNTYYTLFFFFFPHCSPDGIHPLK